MSNETFFLPYQKKWIEDRSRLKIMEKSRQIGLSWSTAYRVVRQHVLRKNRLDTWVSSRDEMQARLFITDCKLFASLFENLAKSNAQKAIAGEIRTTSLSLPFANGSCIYSLSSSPDAQAGKRGNRILDEFALHPDPKLLYSIAAPGITWGGQLEIISTHRGSQNFFYQLIQEITENGNPKQFSHHRVTLQDALEQGFLKKLKAKLPPEDPRQHMTEADYFDFIRSTCPDEAIFQQEYMCRPLDERSAFLPYELLSANEYSAKEPWEIALPSIDMLMPHLEKISPQGDLFLGIDVGREHDLTVFWLLEMNNEIAYTRKVLALQGQPFSEQERVLSLFFQLPKLRRVSIDQTGIGRQFAEQAQERYGQHRVEGITFTASTKEALAYPVRIALENSTLRIPADAHIRADLHLLRREVSSSGNLRFAAHHQKNSHADRFWALALALHAAQSAPITTDEANSFFHVWERNERPCLL